jgi:hypothetical protein
MTVHHVFLTRFNLPSGGVESRIRAREGWLRERIELFERYTVPSVRAQDTASAAWLVYLDPESPTWLLERMGRHAAEHLLTPLLRTMVGRAELRDDLSAGVPGAGAGDVLVTTNLDNDDGLARDFVTRVTGTPGTATRTAIYLTTGLIRSPQGLYLRRDRCNAFCSVREPFVDPVTCWADWHNLLHRHMPVQEVGGPPAWLQVVHGSNVSNRVRGRRVSPRRHDAAFGPLLADVTTPGRGEVARDRLLAGPQRVARESLRAGGKRLILGVGGKEGLDRVKEVRARVSARR